LRAGSTRTKVARAPGLPSRESPRIDPRPRIKRIDRCELAHTASSLQQPEYMAIEVRNAASPIGDIEQDIELKGSMSIPTNPAWLVLKDALLAHPRRLTS